jgi:hypothetical protein
VGQVIALINEEFIDSADVTVVKPGDLRWHASLPDGGVVPPSSPALDAQGRVYLSHRGGGGQEWLSSFEHDGRPVFTVSSCASRLSPSVTSDGSAYTTGIGCTQRHERDGTVAWTVPFGTFDGGLAVATDGSVVILQAQNAYLTRISRQGDVLWEDTLHEDRATQTAAPSIARNGDIYIGWRPQFGGPHWLSRVSPLGNILWTVPDVGYMYGAGAVPVGDRIVSATRYGNVGIHDTSGVLIWEREWGQVTTAGVSEPVVDLDGNIYIQSSYALMSYDAAGEIRWYAEPLGSDCGFGVGAPTLLADGQLLVQCNVPDGTELCAVDAADGAVAWRSGTNGGICGSPAVSPDGTIYVAAGTELLALWGRVPPLTEGWPTQGGSMRRLHLEQ